MIQKKYIIIILVLIANSCFAQPYASSRFDSLSGKSFEYLKNRYEAAIADKEVSKIYVAAWLKKAKSEKDNYLQLALAYRAEALLVDIPLQIRYADSMLFYARRTNDRQLIGSCYMAKGILLYNHNQQVKALDNYLLADRYIVAMDVPVLNFQIKYGIAQIKYYLGFYYEAISLYRECSDFYKEENDQAFLASSHGLGLCYTRLGKYKMASEVNRRGILDGRRFNNTGFESYFRHSEGINQCYQGNYNVAIQLLKSALPDVIQLHDYTSEAVAYFYIGKSNSELKRYDAAIGYFKKVDAIFQKQNYVQPDVRSGYEYLIDYFKETGNTTLELFYINQLLTVDKTLANDYKYLLRKVVKEYDTKELVAAKKAIENRMLFTQVMACVIIGLMVMVIISLYRRNKRNLKLFKDLMTRDTSNTPPLADSIIEIVGDANPETEETDTIGKQPVPEITKEIEDAILLKLEKFESTKKYLENDMNLTRMAAILHTNSKYVTRIISKHRNKGTIEYITELKLDYIIEKLKTDTRYRNYTNKALGDEAGFRTTQNFTRAFKSYTGITPTYFSSKLKRSQSTDDSD